MDSASAALSRIAEAVDVARVLPCEWNVRPGSGCPNPPRVLNGIGGVFRSVWASIASTIDAAAAGTRTGPLGCGLWHVAQFPGWWIGGWWRIEDPDPNAW